MQTTRYRTVLPKIDRWRSISAVGGRLREIDDRLREIKDRRKREEEEEEKKKRRKNRTSTVVARRSPARCRPRPVVAHGSPLTPASDFSPMRGDRTSPHTGRKIEATKIASEGSGDGSQARAVAARGRGWREVLFLLLLFFLLSSFALLLLLPFFSLNRLPAVDFGGTVR
ncbi:hypothetical protein GW17_00018432 [Ensete ventricosum]|nr:hypothetical protein GW17_00018432 [Ensete ventricosum]